MAHFGDGPDAENRPTSYHDAAIVCKCSNSSSMGRSARSQRPILTQFANHKLTDVWQAPSSKYHVKTGFATSTAHGCALCKQTGLSLHDTSMLSGAPLLDIQSRYSESSPEMSVQSPCVRNWLLESSEGDPFCTPTDVQYMSAFPYYFL